MPDTPATRPRPGRLRWLWLIVAYLSIGLAMLGVLLPGLPTTEFVLLAAWAASRSSPRLSAWLENHRLFGPLLLDWRDGGIITRQTKLVSALLMSVALLIMLLTVHHRPSILFAALGMACGAAWIWSRPERRSKPATSADGVQE
ncbi:YbaN family protein [Stutzerimonas kirkiae]|uniref:YbaN family protein n=1 Tax=Stutzerimonas kirkiae TaxID=2211392 RepID=UPI001F602D34|nr:YbaN family protein [Stutzerimonas kirkiae]